GQADYGDLYELPVAFGSMPSTALVAAINRLLAEAGLSAESDVTSVQRRKVTLRLAMASLLRKVERAGRGGIPLSDCFERPLVRLEVIMTFLGLLELLRQLKVAAEQDSMHDEIRLRVYDPALDEPASDGPDAPD
ncbi:MAG: hypothetical protein ACLQVD_06675, partial [Capsulimonadaceae bacterium]